MTTEKEKKPKKFSNIKVDVVSIVTEAGPKVRKAFFEGLDDYCTRFNVKPSDKRMKVSICLVEYPDPYEYDFKNGVTHGVTIWNEESNRIVIQVRDPFLNDWENNFYVVQQFLAIMFHEFVHAYQHITGRIGVPLNIKHDKTSDRESYFFDKSEMEARLLEMPYMVLMGSDLL